MKSDVGRCIDSCSEGQQGIPMYYGFQFLSLSLSLSLPRLLCVTLTHTAFWNVTSLHSHTLSTSDWQLLLIPAEAVVLSPKNMISLILFRLVFLAAVPSYLWLFLSWPLCHHYYHLFIILDHCWCYNVFFQVDLLKVSAIFIVFK